MSHPATEPPECPDLEPFRSATCPGSGCPHHGGVRGGETSRSQRSIMDNHSDQLAARALREAWTIPADRVAEMVRSLVDIITSPTSRPREKTSALRSLMQVRQLNLEAIRTA